MKTKHFRSFLFCFAFLVVSSTFLGGCSKEKDADSGSISNTASADKESAAATEAPSPAVSETPEEPSAAAYPLTVENFTAVDNTREAARQEFKKAPERVVANNQSTAELLIHLGLTDKIAGVAALYGEIPSDIAEEFKKIPVLSEGYVGKELVLGANPDLVIGRGQLFADADWGVGTVKDLNALGINTYLLNSSLSGATLDSLYKDITEIGNIFDEKKAADAFIAQLKTRQEALKTGIAGSDKIYKYAYVFDVTDGSASVYSGNTDTFQNDALNLIHLDNAFKDVTGEVNLEKLISANPDILLISAYAGGPDTEKMVKELYNIPSLSSISAIKKKQIYIIDYNQFWGYSYQIFDGLEALAAKVYPDKFNHK